MKIIVIGAGLIGTATAYFLKCHGHDVEVIDREKGPAMDTSFANGGMLTPSQSEPWNHPGITWNLVKHFGNPDSPIRFGIGGLSNTFMWGLKFLRNSSKQRFYRNMIKNACLTTYSMQVLRQLRDDLGLKYDDRGIGTLKIFTGQEEYAHAIEHSHVYRDLSVNYQLLDAAETLKKEPSLEIIKSSLKGGIYYPDDESGDAHKFCQLLAGHAVAAGVKFHYQTQVKGFEYQGNDISGIITDQARIEADKYILAAGSYSTLLAKTAGIYLPVRPVKGYSLTLDIPDNVARPGIPVIDESRHIAMATLGSRLRVAGTAELNGYNRSIDNSQVMYMLDYLGSVYPGIVAATSEKNVNAWSGLRPYSADGVPFIGKTVYSNLYINTGHGHLGWTMCAGSGKLLADILDGNRTEIDIQPYSLER